MDKRAAEYARQIIDAYINGRHTEELDDRFQSWLSDDNFLDEKDGALDSYWQSFDTLESEFTYSSLEKIKSDIGFPAKRGRRKASSPRRSVAWMIAAVAIPFAILIAGGLFLLRDIAPKQEIAQETPEETGVANIEVAASPDADKKIMLVDGTQIWIKKGSRLSYPATYETGRTVNLIGEAFFKVAKNEEVPFVINTEHMAVSVTGTELNVAAYKSGADTKVTLHSGSVEVEAADGGGKYRMKPGEHLVMDNAANSIALTDMPVGVISDWREEKLQFDYLPLKDIFDGLSTLYNIAFDYDTTRLGCDCYSFWLNGTESLSEVLAMVARLSGKFTYEIVVDSAKVKVFSN